MILNFNLHSIKYRGRQYDNGNININEETDEAEITYNKRSFLKIVNISIIKFKYNSSTRVEVNNNVIFINDIELITENKNVSDGIVRCIRKPYVEVVKRREEIMHRVEASIRDFLVLRATILDQVQGLEKNPRETMLQFSSVDSESMEDPVQLIHRFLADKNNQAYEEMSKQLSQSLNFLDEKTIQKIYALIYCIGTLQNDILLNDEPDIIEALNFVSKNFMCKQVSMSDLEGFNIEKITENLLDSSFEGFITYPLDIIDNI